MTISSVRVFKDPQYSDFIKEPLCELGFTLILLVPHPQTKAKRNGAQKLKILELFSK